MSTGDSVVIFIFYDVYCVFYQGLLGRWGRLY